MSTESTPAPQNGVAEDGHKGPRIAVSALVAGVEEQPLELIQGQLVSFPPLVGLRQPGAPEEHVVVVAEVAPLLRGGIQAPANPQARTIFLDPLA